MTDSITAQSVAEPDHIAPPLRVLIIEDSKDDALLLVRELRTEHPDLEYKIVETAQAMQQALAEPWGLITSDYVLPQFSGPAALKVLQESGQDLPFLVVSGQIGEETAVMAMKAGAHDYIMKDSLARLCPAVDREIKEARIRRQRREARQALRRSEAYHRQLAEARHTLLDELDHRVRNNLAGLLYLVTMMEQSAASPTAFAKDLTARLEAMIVGYDVVSESDWKHVDLALVLDRLFDRFLTEPSRRNAIHHKGSGVNISPSQVGPLVMLLQELLSNCTRHGALSKDTGKVNIAWTLPTTPDDTQTVRMVWEETGGPPITTAPDSGMGIKLAQGFARSELGGNCEFDFRPAGLRCTIQCALEQVSHQSGQDSSK